MRRRVVQSQAYRWGGGSVLSVEQLEFSKTNDLAFRDFAF
jgi:hypothetical protein